MKRSKLTSKPSQLPASSAVKDELGVIDDSMSAEKQEEEGEEESDGSCSPGGQGGEEEGVADSNDGSVASDSDSDHHHQDYSDEELDSDGEDDEARDGSHDGVEFSAKSTCYYNRGYNGSNDIHDKPIVVYGGLDHGHDQHEGRDQYHHPPGVTDWFICWYRIRFLIFFDAKYDYDQ